MKVFLTGVTGYVGHQLALELADQNYEVNALVRNAHSNKVPKHEKIKIFEGNICDYKSIVLALKGCDYVFHTAAYTNLKCNDVDKFYNTNVIGTENVLKAALELGVKKVIYTSTLAVYGPSFKQVPITELQPRIASYSNDYELTKSMSEEVVQDYVKKGLHCTILNISRVYGPGLKTYSNGINKLIEKIKCKDFLLVPSKLEACANYVFIKDVVNAHILAINHAENGEKYIIGGENINYQGLFSKVKKLTKSKIKIIKINYNFLKSCFSIVNKFRLLLGEQSSVTPKVLNSLFTNRISSSTKAISELKYKVTPLNTGLLQTINHLNIKS